MAIGTMDPRRYRRPISEVIVACDDHHFRLYSGGRLRVEISIVVVVIEFELEEGAPLDGFGSRSAIEREADGGAKPSLASAPRHRRLLIIAAVIAACMGGCGSESSESTTSQAKDGRADIDRLSAATDLALVAMPEDVYVLLDGGDRQRGTAESTTIWRVDAAGETEVATLDVPLRSPHVWRSGDDEVTVIGMNCPTLEDPQGLPACAEAPLVAATIDLSGRVEMWEVGVNTSGSAGFSAGPSGSDGIVMVAVGPDDAVTRALTMAALGEAPVDHGPIGASLVCSSPDGAFLVPSELSAENNSILKVGADRIEPAGSIAPLDVSFAAITSCVDGGAILRAMTSDGVENFVVDVASPDTLMELEIPPEYERGEVAMGAGGQAFSWVADSGASWHLAEERNGSWVRVGNVTSIEPPQHTVRAASTYAALITQDGTLGVEIIS